MTTPVPEHTPSDPRCADGCVWEYGSDFCQAFDVPCIKARNRMTAPYRTPPGGWRDFGFHAPLDSIPALTCSDEAGEDGLPLWEQHEGCTCTPDRES